MALDVIVANKRREVAERRLEVPLKDLTQDLAPSDRSLERALERPRACIIFECKSASPSRGVIRGDYDAPKLARLMEPCADAISVLADRRFFGGSLGDVRAVRDAVGLPVLCKDVVVDPYQVYEARRYGADAVLLMLCVLDDATMAACLAAARKLSMDALVEVRDAAELARALAHDARIVGINNRDLGTLEVSLCTTERLAEQVPDDRLVVSESGISSHDDIRRLGHLADAFLIGSAPMGRADVAQACREIAYGRTKICGLTRPADAALARDFGASMGGLIFAEVSPRRIDLARAAEIVRAADIPFAGVFACQEADLVARCASELELCAVQLHGDEGADYERRLRGLLPEGCEVWSARVVTDTSPDLQAETADRVLLDSRGTRREGQGHAFEWEMLEGRDLSRTILAGGIGPANAALARSFGAYAIDVCSGVEGSPGIKDERLMFELFKALRHAAGRRTG